MPKGMAQWGEELFMTREREQRHGLAPQHDAGGRIVQRGFEPCLLAVLRLSAGSAPDSRPTIEWFRRALARTGHLPRAAESAYTISGELKRGEELLALVTAAAGAGDLRGAQALAESIPLGLRDQALLVLVPAWARAGERDTATALAERIRYPHNWGKAWALLAKAAADDGDTQGALRFAARADAEVSSSGYGETGRVLALLVEVATAAGDHVRAAELADRVEDSARSRTPEAWSRPQPRALATVLSCEVLSGDLYRVDALLRPSPRPSVGVGGGGGGETGLPTHGETADQDLAPQEVLYKMIAVPQPPGSPLDAWDMTCVLNAVAETVDTAEAAETVAQDVALALADRAETMLDTDLGPDHHTLLRALALLLAQRGQVERAMALADRIDPDQRAGQQAEIVGALARYGETDGAEALAHAITDRRAQTRALIDVVRGLARHGDPDRAETLARTITDPWAQGEALVAVVRELARCGDPVRAEALAHSIAYRATRARALAALAELSEPSHARQLAVQILLLDGWAAVLPVLERIAPRAMATVADQMTIARLTP